MAFSFKSKKINFLPMEKKAFCGLERVLCFPGAESNPGLLCFFTYDSP